MKYLYPALILVLGSIGLAATGAMSPKSEEHARVIYRNLFGIQSIKEKFLYPIQPRLDRVIAYSTAEAQVGEIDTIIQNSAESIAANSAFRNQMLYEYRAEFSEEELAEYARWLESPLSKKIRRFELRNTLLFEEMEARHFSPQIPKLLKLLESAEESTKPKPYVSE